MSNSLVLNSMSIPVLKVGLKPYFIGPIVAIIIDYAQLTQHEALSRLLEIRPMYSITTQGWYSLMQAIQHTERNMVTIKLCDLDGVWRVATYDEILGPCSERTVYHEVWRLLKFDSQRIIEGKPLVCTSVA
jgi:hypothetical protein